MLEKKELLLVNLDRAAALEVTNNVSKQASCPAVSFCLEKTTPFPQLSHLSLHLHHNGPHYYPPHHDSHSHATTQDTLASVFGGAAALKGSVDKLRSDLLVPYAQLKEKALHLENIQGVLLSQFKNLETDIF